MVVFRQSPQKVKQSKICDDNDLYLWQLVQDYKIKKMSLRRNEGFVLQEPQDSYWFLKK